MRGMGRKAVSEHISGEREKDISQLMVLICTLVPIILIFSAFFGLSQRGGTSRSTQIHMEENQIYASADEGKSPATFSSFYFLTGMLQLTVLVDLIGCGNP